MNPADCYKLLELSFGSSHQEVRAARRTLLMQWHPDKVAHNPALQEIALEQSKQINIAADFLLAQQPFITSPPPPYQQQPETNTGSNSRTGEEYRRQDEEDRRQASEEANRRQQQEAEERRQQEALAAEQQARRKAQQEAEAAQRAEQLIQREAAKKAKARRPSFLLAACGAIVFIHWCEVELRQANQAPKTIPQQVYSAPQDAAPVDTQANNLQTVEGSGTDTKKAKWQEISGQWAESDNGRVFIGIPRIEAEGVLGEPTLKFRRPDGENEEMWFTQDSKGYISIVLQDDKVTQVETVIATPGGDSLPGSKSIHLSDVKQEHPNLQVSAYGYDLSKYAGVDGHDAENAYDEEIKHFQGDAVTYYYDDVQNGITFAFGVQDYFDKSIQIEKIIVHRPGTPVFPASNGRSQPPVDEVPDATHPPNS